MISLSRADAATVSGMSESELNYMIKLGILGADVGGQRKRFSPLETRLAIVAGAAMESGCKPNVMKDPIIWLRAAATYPEDVCIPDDPAVVMKRLQFSRYKALNNGDERVEKLTKEYLAYSALASDLAPDLFVADKIDAKEIAVGILADELRNKNKAASNALFDTYLAKAEIEMGVGDCWSADHCNAIELALSFELATIGKRQVFFQFAADDDHWATRLSTALTSLDGFTHWNTISLTALFAKRPILG